MRRITTVVPAAALAVGMSGMLAVDHGWAAHLSSDAHLQLAQAGDYQKQIAPNPGSEVQGRDNGQSQYPNAKVPSSREGTSLGEPHPGTEIIGRRADKAFGPEGELRGTHLIGAPVYGANGEQIGEVADVVIGKDGELKAVLGVGGYLGLGEREIAVDWDKLNVERQSRDADNFKLTVNMTEDQLRSMKEYDYDSVSTQDRPEYPKGNTVQGIDRD